MVNFPTHLHVYVHKVMKGVIRSQYRTRERCFIKRSSNQDASGADKSNFLYPVFYYYSEPINEGVKHLTSLYRTCTDITRLSK